MNSSITVNQLYEILQSNQFIDLIDVRTAAEFATSHIHQSKLAPYDQFDCDKILRSHNISSPIYLVCQSGSRARRAVQKFQEAGFSRSVVVEGGIEAWTAAGLPLEKGSMNVLPLDRQLRIVMGLLVLTGVVFSQWLHPDWIWLSGFVGAGLIFAGLTDICLLRGFLAKMPWNRIKTSTSHKI